MVIITNLTRRPLSTELLSTAYNVLFKQVRYANRPNLQRPQKSHYLRARMLAVCEPVFPPEPKNCSKETIDKLTTCVDNPVADNPYAIFLAGQMRRELDAYPMTIILHCNHYTQHQMIDIKGALYDMKYEMLIREYISHKVARLALTGSKWSPLLPLLKSWTTLGFCSSDDIPRLQKALKKMPQFVLLAALVHGRILHKDSVEEMGKLQNITNVRAQLSSTFALQSVTLSQNLTANINAFSHSLNTYAKGETNEQDPPESTTSSSDSDSDSSSSSSSDSDNEEIKK